MTDLLEPPFTRKRIGPDYVWAHDLQIAFDFCQARGLQLVKAPGEYQVAKIVGDDVRLVIYPHKTSASNHHLRVRDENSKNRRRAQALMALLNHAAGFDCTFSCHWPVNDLAHRWRYDLINPALVEAVEREASCTRSVG